ncbi:MAG TPA: aspartate/glutamate racemase family protein [Steroidobacteraceae bacterium]|nr:aspartate/glutamate racemase family protein [Steroidobacteraceae bacterium]
MAIGLFDSGVGGLTIHRAVVGCLPTADVVYLADQAHMPYGTRSSEEIVQLTRAGCERLFLEGCDLVILACNTASAVALHRLQESWLPGFRQTLARAVNVLGIIVPTIEAVTGRAWNAAHSTPVAAGPREAVGILATQATVRSAVYPIEIAKRRNDLRVIMEACPGLAAMIERRVAPEALSRAIDRHLNALRERIGRSPDKVILGSTHYEVVAELFRRALPASAELIQQPRATAEALQAYVARHGEYRVGTRSLRRYLTTARHPESHPLVEAYCGESLRFEPI